MPHVAVDVASGRLPGLDFGRSPVSATIRGTYPADIRVSVRLKLPSAMTDTRGQPHGYRLLSRFSGGRCSSRALMGTRARR
jgi:hypothetical protein